MTKEETIKGLNACIADAPDKCWENGDYPACPYNSNVDGCQLRMMKDVAELLKEQEPVKPVVDIDTWRCGNCGHKLEHQELLGENVLFHEQYNYCPECGRAVKWE